MNDEQFEGFEDLDNVKIEDNIDNTPITDNSIEDLSQDNNIDQPPTPRNQIHVHINDQKTPIVLLFGAQQSGKTMTLVRLSNYLRPLGYKIEIEKNFCTTAWEYKVNSDNFNQMLSTPKPLKGTNYNDFLFIRISDKFGNPICYILEAAGEDYFSKQSDPRRSFPNYMQSVFNTPNRKIWLFITEPNWEVDHGVKQNYVDRIRFCKDQSTGKKDKFIILYNKIDKTSLISGGKINTKVAETQCGNEYSGIFDIFTEDVILFGKTKKYKFVPFSTGSYDEYGGYTRSRDEFPSGLWKSIQESIKPTL